MKRLVFEAHYQVSFVTDTFVHVDIVETVLLRKGFVGGGGESRQTAEIGWFLWFIIYYSMNTHTAICH